MELIPELNDLYELDHYYSKETNKTITKEITVTPAEGFFFVNDKIFNGEDIIFDNEFTIDFELIKELNKLI
ncbi:MAG: hypothetical protein E6X43_07620 [Peptostreptococcaceae bacterium]|nr:hypothetical protein [Peptostreptococcaceae bacterium]